MTMTNNTEGDANPAKRLKVNAISSAMPPPAISPAALSPESLRRFAMFTAKKIEESLKAEYEKAQRELGERGRGSGGLSFEEFKIRKKKQEEERERQEWESARGRKADSSASANGSGGAGSTGSTGNTGSTGSTGSTATSKNSMEAEDEEELLAARYAWAQICPLVALKDDTKSETKPPPLKIKSPPQKMKNPATSAPPSQGSILQLPAFPRSLGSSQLPSSTGPPPKVGSKAGPPLMPTFSSELPPPAPGGLSGLVSHTPYNPLTRSVTVFFLPGTTSIDVTLDVENFSVIKMKPFCALASAVMPPIKPGCVLTHFNLNTLNSWRDFMDAYNLSRANREKFNLTFFYGTASELMMINGEVEAVPGTGQEVAGPPAALAAPAAPVAAAPVAAAPVAAAPVAAAPVAAAPVAAATHV
jgi:hypothetical protein